MTDSANRNTVFVFTMEVSDSRIIFEIKEFILSGIHNKTSNIQKTAYKMDESTLL